ncbi:MAG: serine hydrolase [Bacteroidetes bacterium]|nr:serine hydrolase [Bacteroidota bacterium]
MKRHAIHWILIFCAVAAKLSGQPAPDVRVYSNTNLGAEAWAAAKSSIVLLRNENALLPVKNLDGQRISWLTFGLPEKNVFEETLAKYVRDGGPQKLPLEKDLLIVALDAARFSPLNPDFQQFGQQVKMYAGRSSVVAVLFGNPQVINDLEVLRQAGALLFVPGTDDASQSVAAQIIFGGCAANGTLAADLGIFFQRGSGISTGQTRLGYAPPETVGLNGQLLEDSITAIVEAGIRAQAYPGAQVLVAKDGQVVFHKTWGYHTYDSLQAVSPTDLYDFASVTKVTSTLPALMKLYGEGRFDLDAPLKTYLPFFKKSDKADVTYRQFLAHNGRLKPSIVFWREAQDGHGHWKKRSFRNHCSKRYPIRIADSLFLFKNYKKQIYKGIRDLPLNEKPGYVYSDLSFILYPKVVEKLTGEPLEKYLNETFYGPLGATTLTYNPLLRFPVGSIVPTERDTFFRKTQVHGTVHDETAAMLGGVSGHAGLFGSANDLAKLVQLYLNGGEYGGERFISEAAVREFTRCQFCGEGNRRGLGFDKPLIEYDPAQSYVAKDASPASFGHSGYTGTFFWADPAYNLQVIFLSNRVYPDRSHTGLSDLNIRPRVQQVVYDAMRNFQPPRND